MSNNNNNKYNDLYYTVIWIQILQFDTNPFETDLFDP